MITLDPPKQKRRSLKSLQEANIPRLDWRTMFTITGEELSSEDVAALDAYFCQFIAPKDGCVSCGAQQGAKNIVEAFLGAHFRWGLGNGEGFCGKCKYPARAYHRNIGPIKFLEMILQYHPKELEASRPAAADSVPDAPKRSDGSEFSQTPVPPLPLVSVEKPDLGEPGAVDTFSNR